MQSNLAGIVPTKLEHETHLFGTVNNQHFDLLGRGTGFPYDGKLDTHLISQSGPLHFSMFILSPISIMGYPTFSYYQRGGYDLFKISNGYRYTRSLQFDCGGFMRTEHNIIRHSKKLVGEFEVTNADFNAPEGIIEIEPCVETFYPAGPGKIQSKFTTRWKTIDGKVYCAQVNSEYFLTHNMELPFPHFRLVQFVTDHSQLELKQKETLLVLCDFERLGNDLTMNNTMLHQTA